MGSPFPPQPTGRRGQKAGGRCISGVVVGLIPKRGWDPPAGDAPHGAVGAQAGMPMGAAQGEDPPGDAHGGDTELGDARQGTTVPGIPPRGDTHGKTPNPGVLTAGHPPWGCAPGARGWGSPRAGLAPAGAQGQVFWGGSAGKGAGGAEAEARRLRTCEGGAAVRAGGEDLEVKRWQIVKKVIVRCPIYYSFIVG